MAQLKDTLIQGSARITDTLYTTTAQLFKLSIPTTSGGSTYGFGSNGQVVRSNGTSTYWGPPVTTNEVYMNWSSTSSPNTDKQLVLTVNGSTAGTIKFVAGSNITLTAATGNPNTITIASSYINDRDPGYGVIIVTGSSDSTTGLTAASGSVTATDHSETLKYTVANKWLTMSASNGAAGADEIKIGHATVLSSGTAGTKYGQASAATPAFGGSFSVPNLTVDAAGHVTQIGHVNVTLPTPTVYNGYGKVTITNSSGTSAPTTTDATVSSVGANETLKITGANKWITFQGIDSSTGGADEIKIGHLNCLTSGSAGTAYGTTTTQTYYAGASTNPSFKVPKITADAAGHITSISEATVTIAHQDTSSVSNLTANGRKYVTGLTFDTYGHVTGYTTGTETVTDTDTKVSQSGINTGPWRKVLISNASQNASSTTQSGTTTDVVYFHQQISANATNGTLRAQAYRVVDNVELQYNSNTNALDFVFV